MHPTNREQSQVHPKFPHASFSPPAYYLSESADLLLTVYILPHSHHHHHMCLLTGRLALAIQQTDFAQRTRSLFFVEKQHNDDGDDESDQRSEMWTSMPSCLRPQNEKKEISCVYSFTVSISSYRKSVEQPASFSLSLHRLQVMCRAWSPLSPR